MVIKDRHGSMSYDDITWDKAIAMYPVNIKAYLEEFAWSPHVRASLPKAVTEFAKIHIDAFRND